MPRQSRPTDAMSLANQSHHANLAIAAVSLEFGLTETDIKHPKLQSTHLRFARQVAMYLVNVVFEVNHTHISRLFAKDRSTVSHACKVIEESREDEVLDLKLIRLENFLRQAPRPVITKEGVA